MNLDEELVRLPAGMRLWSWKVRSGASVQQDEIIALLVDRNAKEGTSTGTSASLSEKKSVTGASEAPNASHKRPTKRRKPTAAIFDAQASTGAPATALQSTLTKTIPLIAPRAGIVTIFKAKMTSDASLLAQIAPCRHETVIDRMCAVCGNQVKQKSSQQSTDTVSGMNRLTVGGGLTVAISEAEGRRMAQQDAKRLQQQRKLSLVLDLDHTLVHATADSRAKECLSQVDVRSLVLPIVDEKQRTFWMHHYVKLRPHVKEFLEQAMELFEIGVYTAGTRQYAEEIAMILARHMAGAGLDYPDLEKLKYDIALAEQNLMRQPKADEGASEIAKDKPDNGTEDKEPEPKRRRVMFAGFSPKETKNEITVEHMEEMKKELEEAQELEKRALHIRQKVFAQRIVSRTDVGDLGRDIKSLTRIFPCGGSMALVVDDREDVWANANDVQVPRKGEPPENLLLVRPYHWSKFSGYADVNNASGDDLSGLPDSKEDEELHRETDEQLKWTLDILKRVHKRYYSLKEDDWEYMSVPNIVKTMREGVLCGAQVVLSGLVPLHRQDSSEPTRPRPYVVRYTENLGAKVLPQVSPMTTHVVAARDGTDKILAGRKLGCFVVKPSWLMECLWTLTRRDEIDHLLDEAPRASKSQIQPLAVSMRDYSSSSSDNDDDDDFAAEFEDELMGS